MSIYERLSLRPLSAELQKIAESELNETPERVENDLEHIKDWLFKQHHLNCRTDNQFLISILRSSKFSLQRTKEKLDYYCTIKTLLPEFFAHRDPFNEDIQAVLNAGAILIIPTSTNYNGPKLVLVHWLGCDPNKIPYITIAKVLFMFLEVLVASDDSTVISGIHFWSEMKKWPLGYILQCTPPILKKIITCFQNAFSFRTKGLYLMNIPKAAETVCSLIKSFLSEKMKNRLQLYSESNQNKIFKHIPKELIPREFGGDGPSLEELKIASKKKLESYREWFLEDDNYGTKEELRSGTPKTTAELFGVEGSFRKLIID